MKILIIDFNSLLKKINDNSLNTQTFEIYYDIGRMLDVDITKEACFKLYTRYSNNYGKLRDYICILGPNPDKKRFDEEFFRRYSQLYFHTDIKLLENVKDDLAIRLSELSKNYITALTAAGNVDFIKTTLKNFDLIKYFNIVKAGEYLNLYKEYIDQIFDDNIISTNYPEKIVFSLTENQRSAIDAILKDDKYKGYNIEFRDFFEL